MNRLTLVLVAVASSFLMGISDFPELPPPPKAPPPPNTDSLLPPEGVVQDGRTAITIGHAVWASAYRDVPFGSETEWQHEFKATLSHGVWTVQVPMPPNSLGGPPIIYIAKSDGRVLRIYYLPVRFLRPPPPVSR